MAPGRSVAQFVHEWKTVLSSGLGGGVLSDIIVLSRPPPGKCKILNIYFDPKTGKAVFEYDDEPKA